MTARATADPPGAAPAPPAPQPAPGHEAPSGPSAPPPAPPFAHAASPVPAASRPAPVPASPAPLPAPSSPASSPAHFPPAVGATIAWLSRTYADYYAAHPPEMPDRFTRREFGYLLWPERPGPPPFLRHRAYSDAGRFHWYLRKAGPHSVYYSTAFYRHPGEARMADKQWLGAELIFDLDADHLPEAQAAAAAGTPMPLEEQLAIVKRRFRYLVDEFLLGDFGIEEKDMFLTFSGGRGYHAHVTDARLMRLDAHGRREIVDYVTAKIPAARGSDRPDVSLFIQRKAVAGADRFGRTPTASFLAPADGPGWPGRLTRSLVAALRTNVLAARRSDAEAWLLSMQGIGAKSAVQFLSDFDERKLERIERGYLEQGAVVKKVCQHVLAQAALPLSKGETDEPVTADVKRLIRLPGSLHGKTGLVTKPLALDELDAFDPFRDAVAFAPEAGTVRFTPRGDDQLRLAGETVRVVAGEEAEVPLAHAVFWCGRQQGTVAL